MIYTKTLAGSMRVRKRNILEIWKQVRQFTNVFNKKKRGYAGGGNKNNRMLMT